MISNWARREIWLGLAQPYQCLPTIAVNSWHLLYLFTLLGFVTLVYANRIYPDMSFGRDVSDPPQTCYQVGGDSEVIEAIDGDRKQNRAVSPAVRDSIVVWRIPGLDLSHGARYWVQMAARLYSQDPDLAVSDPLSIELGIDSETPDVDCVFLEGSDMIVLPSDVFAFCSMSPEYFHAVRYSGHGLAAAPVIGVAKR
jgi:hypothetical protein